MGETGSWRETPVHDGEPVHDEKHDDEPVHAVMFHIDKSNGIDYN